MGLYSHPTHHRQDQVAFAGRSCVASSSYLSGIPVKQCIQLWLHQ